LPHKVQLQSFHDSNAHLTEFAGYDLPLWFTGIIPESLAVRNAVGIFDVSHMGRATITGEGSEQFLQYISSNDVSALTDGSGQYSLLCNLEGGIKDDILVFRLQKSQFLIVYNAANRSNDNHWFEEQSDRFNVKVEDISDDVALFALQGPKAAPLMSEVTRDPRLVDLPRFHCAWTKMDGFNVLLSRTGYTGEDGYEIFVWDSPIEDAKPAEIVWEKLLGAGKPWGLKPCGLGARDLLRLEAGLCLYGTDIDETTNPFEARLGFIINLNKEFIGRDRLQEIQREGVKKLRIGLVMQGRTIPRHGFELASEGEMVGEVTSGTLSPTMNRGIAMGYLEQTSAKEGTRVDVRVRERYEPATVTKMPFYDTTKYGYSRRSP